ncbi:DUF1161 domain-containing protein [Phytohalomonas tamaricis]|uniref:DUF1161 domain-containing protein n=1 Tax=Phytohalomonas tamaricis TaxID=2081032 RepID=UPI000D0AF971|nr:DUF1161 domain-containing protein [Phytohalomonas tamaricis]
MKNVFLYSSVLALGYFPLTAAASCEDVMAQIAQKIEANGVPTSQFQLDALPNAEANEAGGQIVGSCENGTRKIVYSRKSAQAGTSNIPSTGSPEERQATPNKQSSSDTQTALTKQTTTEELQPEAQSTSSDQTSAEESQPEAQSSSSEQTSAEESQPEAQSSSSEQTSAEESQPEAQPSSSNKQTSTEGSQPSAQNTSVSGDLRTVEERYKFLLEGTDSDV